MKKVIPLSEIPKHRWTSKGKTAVYLGWYWIKLNNQWIRDYKIGVRK